jgi:hypothetical protein
MPFIGSTTVTVCDPDHETFEAEEVEDELEEELEALDPDEPVVCPPAVALCLQPTVTPRTTIRTARASVAKSRLSPIVFMSDPSRVGELAAQSDLCSRPGRTIDYRSHYYRTSRMKLAHHAEEAQSIYSRIRATTS